VYRVAGVSDAAAFRLNNFVAGLSVLVTIILAALLFNDARIAVLSGIVLALLPMQLHWSNTAAVEPVGRAALRDVDGGGRPLRAHANDVGARVDDRRHRSSRSTPGQSAS
jgi:hypothetical protein